jgi:NTE family protein
VGSATDRAASPGARTALVLSAGGVVGRAYHLAALRALARRRGWTPGPDDLVVGTSAGALVAALLRAGISADEQLDHLLDPTDDLGPVGAAAGAAPVTPELAFPGMGPPTVRPGDVLRRIRNGPRRTPALLSALLPRGGAAMEDHAAWIDRILPAWPRGLAICSVRLPDLRRVVWDADTPDAPSVGTAVAASCAVPGFLAPVQHRGREYVDGGLHTPSNLEVVLERGVDRAIVVAPMSTAGGHSLARPDRPARWLWHRTLRDEVRSLRRAGVPTLVIEPDAAEYRRMPPNLLDERDLVRVATHLADRLDARLRTGALDPTGAFATA